MDFVFFVFVHDTKGGDDEDADDDTPTIEMSDMGGHPQRTPHGITAAEDDDNIDDIDNDIDIDMDQLEDAELIQDLDRITATPMGHDRDEAVDDIDNVEDEQLMDDIADLVATRTAGGGDDGNGLTFTETVGADGGDDFDDDYIDDIDNPEDDEDEDDEDMMMITLESRGA